MMSLIIHVEVSLLVFFLCTANSGFAFNIFLSKCLRQSQSNAILMSSVGPSPKNPIQRKPGIIISPRSSSMEAEMLILDNFNQIREGEIKKIGIIGTQELSSKHKQMVELLTYALVLSGNHVITSGGNNGTNVAVIRGALRACNSDLLTVILPQTIYEQPVEMQPLFLRVVNLIEQPQYRNYELKEAAILCNEKILSLVDEVLVFAYHGSDTILRVVDAVKGAFPVTTFYLD